MIHFSQFGLFFLPLRGAWVFHRVTKISFPERTLFAELLNGMEIVLSNDHSALIIAKKRELSFESGFCFL